MKRLFILGFTMLCIISCSPKVYPVQSCIAISEQNGSVVARSSGYGKEKVLALDAAERNAIETLLFRGIPGTQYNTPMVRIDEVSAKKQFKSYFDDLIDGGRHKSFISLSIPVCDYVLTRYRLWTISSDVTINVSALRKDLEEHGVIRKFGL